MVRKFSNNSDLFQFINFLIDELKKIGEITWALEFENAIRISFMPGEVLGALRTTLLKFQETTITKNIHLDEDIQEAIKVLDNALGPR